MPTLKARIGGTWVPVGGGSTADEVWIGTNTPTDSTTELWYDTDEPNLYEPDTSRWNSAWGVVGRAVNTAGMTGIGATPTDVTGLTVTFTPVAGRQYRTVISWLAVTNVSGTVVPLITDGANTTFMQRNYTVQGGWYFHVNTEVVESGLAAVPTVRKARTSMTTGTVDIIAGTTLPAFITVEDVGPVSLASNPPAQPSSVWTAPTLLNGWANSGAPHQTCQYRLIGDKVELRGRINLGTIGVPIFTLPVGYRPTAATTLATATVVSGNWAFGVVEATVDGNVAAFAPTTNVGLLLNNLSFSVVA